MSHPSKPGFGPRDVVRAVNMAGTRPDCPLKPGNIYTCASIEAVPALHEPGSAIHLVHLDRIPGSFLADRFVLVARAAAPEPVHPDAARMAQVMKAREAATGACTEHDLKRAGFTPAQIATHADAARGIAGAPVHQEAA